MLLQVTNLDAVSYFANTKEIDEKSSDQDQFFPFDFDSQRQSGLEYPMWIPPYFLRLKIVMHVPGVHRFNVFIASSSQESVCIVYISCCLLHAFDLEVRSCESLMNSLEELMNSRKVSCKNCFNQVFNQARLSETWRSNIWIFLEDKYLCKVNHPRLFCFCN